MRSPFASTWCIRPPHPQPPQAPFRLQMERASSRRQIATNQGRLVASEMKPQRIGLHVLEVLALSRPACFCSDMSGITFKVNRIILRVSRKRRLV